MKDISPPYAADSEVHAFSPCEQQPEPFTPDRLTTLLQASERLAAYEAVKRSEDPLNPTFHRVTGLAQHALAAPMSVLTFFDGSEPRIQSAKGFGERSEGRIAGRRAETPFTHAFCQWVVAANETLIVNDARNVHPDFAADVSSALEDIGLVAYMGVPLHAPQGQVLGALCVIDNVPRHWTSEDQELLEQIAGLAESEIALRVTQTATRELRGERAQLLSALDELRRGNESLREFASVASHDLQEPLRKIQAFGGRLQSRAEGALDDEGKDYLKRMIGAADRMQALIHDLLLYSRVTTQARPFAPVDLNEVVAAVLRDLGDSVARAGGEVEVGPLPTVEADPLQMRQLFHNILGNALKFSRKDTSPRIVISAHAATPISVSEETGSATETASQPPTPSRSSFAPSGTKVAGTYLALSHGSAPPPPAALMWKIEIADNGIGFEAQYAERVFGVFERLHLRGEYEGNGMGLALCRRIAERHGGTCAAQSVPDEGSIFTVTLPQRRDS